MLKDLFYKKDETVRLSWAILVLYFNKKVKPLYTPEQGRDMLILAIVFEAIRIGVTFYKNNLGYQDILSTGITALVLLSLVFGVTKILGIKLKDVGLKKLSVWNTYEIVYFILMVPIGFFIFYYFTRDKFTASLQENGWGMMVATFIFYLAWGFYQEWIYRGFIQTELTRRYDAVTAIILANIIFTFGPLHIYQLYQGKFLLIGATFLIGLLFGILYHRSYNLWIVGILHGIGNWFLVGLP
ncbi:MAG TPA: type II CAAX endopeptidase family protein [Chitinophagaceae bacterium]|nr:type II CAAX endopeptidase family protein [Chitinophagaceae bacterium]